MAERRISLSILMVSAIWSMGFNAGWAEEPTPRSVTIETVPGRLLFSPDSVLVKPGEMLRLTVKNHGPVVCNFVICGEGAGNWTQVADLVIDLGASMLARNFDPGPPLVTHGTGLIRPGEEVTLDWRAPQQEGVYPFLSSVPGHVPLMHGEFLVTSKSVGISNLHYRYFEGKWDGVPDVSDLKPIASGVLPGNLIDFDAIPGLKAHLDGRKPGMQSALEIGANVHVPLKSDYTFALASDVPAKLVISHTEVVTHDGTRDVTRFGKVELGAPEPTTELPWMQLLLISNGELKTPGLKWRGAAGSANLSVAKPHVITPDEIPFAATLPMPDASALALAVALQNDLNYCFDPDTLAVRYAWAGGYVDARPVENDGSGRWNGNALPLGEIIPLGAESTFPLRIGRLAEDAPEVRYLGHSTAPGEPLSLMFQVGDYAVSQKVSISGPEHTVTYTFHIEPAPAPGVQIVFSANPDEVEVSTPHGFARNGIAVLTQPEKDAPVVVQLRPSRAER
ncbi:MAG: hypothetical protein O3C21_19270 [Verrucomicrobia bacterium]|nr:hypothetical protein [Verrucomicrobiota bacterium]